MSAPSSRGASRLYRRIYPLRVLGFTLGALAIGSVLWVRQAPLSQWLVMLAGCGLWPHVALWHAARSDDPKRAEMRNLMMDTAFTGVCLPMIAFNPLVSAIMITVTLVDKLNAGRRAMLWQALPVMLSTGLVATWWWQPTPMWETPLVVVLCSLPVFVVHTTVVSMSNHAQLRLASRQNRMLEELSRVDAHTLLATRAHWIDLAEAARLAGGPACLLVIDVDRFKEINDSLGHVVGDEVLRAVAQAVRHSLRAHDEAGRYGGDEFTVLCRAAGHADGVAIAERIRAHVAAVRLRDWPALRVSASIGGACLQPRHASVDQWLAEADAALYAAKEAGRDRAVVSPEAD